MLGLCSSLVVQRSEQAAGLAGQLAHLLAGELDDGSFVGLLGDGDVDVKGIQLAQQAEAVHVEAGPVQGLVVVVPGHGLQVVHGNAGVAGVSQGPGQLVAVGPLVVLEADGPQMSGVAQGLGIPVVVGAQDVHSAGVVGSQGQAVDAAAVQDPVLLVGSNIAVHFLIKVLALDVDT